MSCPNKRSPYIKYSHELSLFRWSSLLTTEDSFDLLLPFHRVLHSLEDVHASISAPWRAASLAADWVLSVVDTTNGSGVNLGSCSLCCVKELTCSDCILLGRDSKLLRGVNYRPPCNGWMYYSPLGLICGLLDVAMHNFIGASSSGGRDKSETVVDPRDLVGSQR